MNSTEKLDLNKCRTCYKATKGLKPLTDLTSCSGSQQISYAELLADVSNINVMEDLHNELPQSICDSCSRKLQAAQAFIQQTHEVNERLMAMLIAQKEANNELNDDVEEAPVQIKMEYDEVVVGEESEVQWQITMKDEPEEILQDDMSGRKSRSEVDAMELFKNSKNSQTKDIQTQLNQMFGVLNKKLDLLTENNEMLKTQLRDIRNQNTMVLDVLSENTDAIEKSLNKNPKFLKMFPINTIDELEEIEDSISEQNINEFIASIRAIAGQGGLKKALSDIMAPKLLIDFNLDGSHNKKRLLNYTKFINVLFHGTYDENCTEKSFKCNLRDALKLVKNRFFKEKCLSNKSDNSSKKIFAAKDDDSQDVQQKNDNT